jgi:hypothetical protein
MTTRMDLPITVEEVRKELRGLLADMEALKPYCDPGSPDSKPFIDAFEVARTIALELAKTYADVLAAAATHRSTFGG